MTKIVVALKKDTQITFQAFQKTVLMSLAEILWPFEKPELILLEGTDSQLKHCVSSSSGVRK